MAYNSLAFQSYPNEPVMGLQQSIGSDAHAIRHCLKLFSKSPILPATVFVASLSIQITAHLELWVCSTSGEEMINNVMFIFHLSEV